MQQDDNPESNLRRRAQAFKEPDAMPELEIVADPNDEYPKSSPVGSFAQFWLNISSNDSTVKKLKGMTAGHDTVIEYHPFAAFARWRKEQASAIPRDITPILFIGIPVLIVCFGFAFSFMNNFEREIALGRMNAAIQREIVENKRKEWEFKQELINRFSNLALPSRLRRYGSLLVIDRSGRLTHLQISKSVDAPDTNTTSVEELREDRKELKRLFQPAFPVSQPPATLLRGRYLLAEVVFLSPKNGPQEPAIEFASPSGKWTMMHNPNNPEEKYVTWDGDIEFQQNPVVAPEKSSELQNNAGNNRTIAAKNTLEKVSLLGCFILGGTVLLALSLSFVCSKPTQIGISKTGWRYLWRRALNMKNGKYVRWSSLLRIYMDRPKRSTSPLDDHLCFKTREGQVFRIKMGSLESIEDRELILKAIQKWAPNVARDPSVLQALQPPADYSYTELWLQALSAPPKRERLKPIANGTRLRNGDYKIIDEIGSGGQGHAYLATNAQKESVVLKEFILPVYVDISVRRSALEQFENEARLLRQIDNPKIVKLIDFFVEDHRTYLVLEHIQGQSLRHIVKNKGSFSEKEVRELAVQMCEILTYLHGLNPPIIHRDFTPDNLILNQDGTLKLIDFNVAKQVIESTTSGTVVGKHAYLPPEQFRGMPECASDIYAMGATLHFLLCGKDPEPISVSHPQKLNPHISNTLNTLVERATALDLKKRYHSINELYSDLTSLV